MKFTQYFKNSFEDIALKQWPDEEKLALMKVIHAIYVADHEFSSLEQTDFKQKLESLGISQDSLDNLKLHKALEILEKDKFKHDLAYSLMADAVFKDDNYNEIEAAFIDYLEEHHAVSREKLEEHIEMARHDKLDVILENWVRQIQDTQL